jgi:Transposase IS4
MQMNNISYYWKTEMFTGHDDFKKTMSRNDFQMIRWNLALRDPDSYSNEQGETDPLWHARKFIEFLVKRSAALAVP